jgi:hypothetical protein
MDYLVSVLPEEQVYPFTFFLSQIIGGKVYLPIVLVGGPRTGKSVLLNLLLDIFKPLVLCMGSSLRGETFNNVLYLNRKPFIYEANDYPKNHRKYTLFDFKNRFDKSLWLDDILKPLRTDYENFILFLLFRYEDYTDSRRGII